MSKCMSGPYLYDDSLRAASPEGIGSSVEHMKLLILLSEAFQLTLIPNPSFFINLQHHTDFFNHLGWNIGLDCHSDDVTMSLNQVGSGSVLRVVNISTANISTKSDVMKQDSELRELCTMMEVGKSRTQQVKRFLTHGMKGGFISQLEYHNRMRSNDMVFVLHRNYWLYNFEGYQCSLDFIRKRFNFANSVTGSAIAASRIRNGNRKFQLAVHFRHGDVGADPTSSLTLTLRTVTTLVAKLFQPSSVLQRGDVDIHFYSEGELSEFQEFESHVPGAIFHLDSRNSAAVVPASEGNSTVSGTKMKTVSRQVQTMSHFQSMISSDILIGSPSAFSSLIAALAQDCVILAPSEHNRKHPKMSWKFSHIPNLVLQKRILDGDLSEFNYYFCNMKLNFHTLHRPEVCHMRAFRNAYQPHYSPAGMHEYLVDGWRVESNILTILLLIICVQCIIILRRRISSRGGV